MAETLKESPQQLPSFLSQVQSYETRKGTTKNIIFHFPETAGITASAVIQVDESGRQSVQFSKLTGQIGEGFDSRGPQGLTKEELGVLTRESSHLEELVRNLQAVQAGQKSFNLKETLETNQVVFDFTSASSKV